jgi:hypothetical protein
MEDKIYYGNYNEEGAYIGFYVIDIHGDNIPSPCIELNYEKWQEAINGDYKVIDGVHTYIEPVLLTQEEMNEILLETVREERNSFLSSCDWTQLNDCKLSESKKLEWTQYRQALRDFPSTVDLNNIVYPEKPS